MIENYNTEMLSTDNCILLLKSEILHQKKKLDKFEDWVVFSFALDTQLTGSLKDNDIRVGLCSDHCFNILDWTVHDKICTERACNHVAADIGS